MQVLWDNYAWEDYLWWNEYNPNITAVINDLIREIVELGHRGVTGKPEPLRDNFSGFWSRQIVDEHRLVYAWTGRAVLIASCRFHQ